MLLLEDPCKWSNTMVYHLSICWHAYALMTHTNLQFADIRALAK